MDDEAQAERDRQIGELMQLPWANPWWWSKRCRAPYRGPVYRGRCELKRGHAGQHALERGMDVPRW